MNLDATHVMMNKFGGPTDNNYTRVSEKVKQICEQIPTFVVDSNSREEVSNLYERAVESFKKNLLLDDLKYVEEFHDVDSLSSAIISLSSSHYKLESRLRAVGKMFTRFSNRLERYFVVVTAIGKVNSDTFGTLLGSMAMIFKVRHGH
jgi:hypothetical protein